MVGGAGGREQERRGGREEAASLTPAGHNQQAHPRPLQSGFGDHGTFIARGHGRVQLLLRGVGVQEPTGIIPHFHFAGFRS